MKKPELLIPAGNLEALRTAILYGADAVFIGGQSFSLRARASNFSLDDMKEATAFAHKLGKKVYVTTNIIPHHEDFDGLLEYLKGLESAHIDAIITASPYIVDTALKQTSLEVHLSTQQSAINARTVNFWYKKGVKRIVLGRELDKHQIKELKEQTEADIEVFIHGGMCMSYSGRCSLSDNMTGRDANRGGCAHSCRWQYEILDGKEKINDTYFSMSSKDLEAIEQIPFLIDANIASLKIEGRMKSLHYIATVVSTYRKLIDEYLATNQIKDYEPYIKAMEKTENRLASHGYLEGMPGVEQQLYNMRSETPNQLFIGLVKSYDKESGYAMIEQRNYFENGENVEVLMPSGKEIQFKIEEIYDVDGKKIDICRHPKQLIKVKVPEAIEEHAMLRRLS